MDAPAPHPQPLAGQAAVITGASRGIGRAVARRLERDGARIATIQRGEGPGVSVSADLSSPEAAEAAFAQAADALGRVDVCVHVAGISIRSPLLELSLEDWRQVLDVNLTSAFVVTRAAARCFVAQDSPGRIVHVSSMLATFGGYQAAAYSASKGGVVQLMRSQSNEWASLGIRVNAVAPGYILTELTQPVRDDPERDKHVTPRIPTGRWGTPEEVADAVAWLAGPSSGYVTGSVVTVDGGYSLR